MQNFTFAKRKQDSFTTRQAVSTISSKGQITLPVEVRKHLGVSINDRVAFVVGSTGEVRVTHVKYPDIQSLSGVAGTLKQPLSFKQMRGIAHEDRLKKKYGK